MLWSLWIIAIVGIIIAIITFNTLHSIDWIQSSAKDIEISRFFSTDYYIARQRFIHASLAIGAQVLTHPVLGESEMYIDIAVLKRANDRCVIHISGTHGVEGYAGSAIQLSALQNVFSTNDTHVSSNESTNHPTVFLIHALNPYGFVNNRRVNENNIDLNRNFLSPSLFNKFIARNPNFAGYDDLRFLLNPSKSFLTGNTVLDELYTLWLVVYCSLRYGVHRIKTALVSGNYYHPNGLGYGGNKPSKSSEILISLLDTEHMSECKRVVLIDVHTGLGPFGVDSLDISPPDNQEITYPTETVSKGSKVVSKGGKIIGGLKASLSDSSKTTTFAGYTNTRGTIGRDFCDIYLRNHHTNVTCITQEFGTYSDILMGRTLFAENSARLSGDMELIKEHSIRLKNAFCPESFRWKHAVVRRGVLVLRQAIHSLIDDPEGRLINKLEESTVDDLE